MQECREFGAMVLVDNEGIGLEPLGPVPLKGVARPLPLYQAFRTS
jgi:hypothetical protein